MTILYISLVLYVVIKTVFVETAHDATIIGDWSTKLNEGKWKFYGAIMVATELIALSVFSGLFLGALNALLLFLVLGIAYSICHDCGISYRLTGGFFTSAAPGGMPGCYGFSTMDSCGLFSNLFYW